MIIGLSTIVVSILWVTLWTLIFAKKNWKSTPIYGSISILLIGLIFLSSTAISKSILWINQGIYTSILLSTKSALFFPIIQILYLGLSCQRRFRAKIAIEMIALPIMRSVPSLMIQGLMIIFGSINAITTYLKIIILIFMVLLVIAGKKMSSKFLDKSFITTN